MLWSEFFSFVLGIVTTLAAKPALNMLGITINSHRVNQSGAKSGGDIVGRDKIGGTEK